MLENKDTAKRIKPHYPIPSGHNNPASSEIPADVKNKLSELLNTNNPTSSDFSQLLAATRIHELCWYVTVNTVHRNEICRLARDISKYAEDSTRHRPLSFIINAPPGTGKSFFVESLAKSMEQLNDHYVLFNMANMRTIEDLAPAVDTARNMRVRNLLPILFLDEFDADAKLLPILLPLLWDGVLWIRGTPLRLGKCVIALAGSDQAIVDEMEKTTIVSDQISGNWSKLPDLRSRLSVKGIKIPDFDWNNDDTRIDRLIVFAVLFQARFKKQNKWIVPLALFRFIDRCHLKYSSRSMAILIDRLSANIDPVHHSATATINDINTLFENIESFTDSGLVHHFKNDAQEVCELWAKIRDANNKNITWEQNWI